MYVHVCFVKRDGFLICLILLPKSWFRDKDLWQSCQENYLLSSAHWLEDRDDKSSVILSHLEASLVIFSDWRWRSLILWRWISLNSFLLLPLLTYRSQKGTRPQRGRLSEYVLMIFFNTTSLVLWKLWCVWIVSSSTVCCTTVFINIVIIILIQLDDL